MSTGQPLDVVHAVADNVVRLRQMKRLSLSELANQSGVGKATLSALESGRGNPTVETLWSLSTALGVSFGELVSKAEQDAITVSRISDLPPIRGEADEVRLIDSIVDTSRVEMFDMKIPAGELRHSRPHGAGVVETLLVLSGALRVTVDDVDHNLVAGQMIRFGANVPHSYANVAAAKSAHAHSWITYPHR